MISQCFRWDILPTSRWGERPLRTRQRRITASVRQRKLQRLQREPLVPWYARCRPERPSDKPANDRRTSQIDSQANDYASDIPLPTGHVTILGWSWTHRLPECQWRSYENRRFCLEKTSNFDSQHQWSWWIIPRMLGNGPPGSSVRWSGSHGPMA